MSKTLEINSGISYNFFGEKSILVLKYLKIRIKDDIELPYHNLYTTLISTPEWGVPSAYVLLTYSFETNDPASRQALDWQAMSETAYRATKF